MGRRLSLHEAICEGVRTGKLNEPFRVADVNRSLSGLLEKSPSFLSKHRVGNPGGYTEYFFRKAKGEYVTMSCT
ncbi:MAG: hypothetical protein HWE24_16680 [Oceanospirillaceae bacterium]|nr:hypothetical protein [Oceanospirillaceae bacterium]